MRTFAAVAILVGLSCGVAHAMGAVPLPTIDLDEVGTLEALKTSNPAHYEKIVQIVDGVLTQPDANVPRWMLVNFGARGVKYAPIVLTSFPAKRRLSFVLDLTRYETIVLLTNIRGDIVPARRSR